MEREHSRVRAGRAKKSPALARAKKTARAKDGTARVRAEPPSARTAAKRKATASAAAARSGAAKRAAAEATDLLGRLRAICLALPEASEKEAWQTPTFRVRGKMFAMFADDHHGDGRIAVWCKAPLGAQEALVESDPEHFFRPPYVGPSGWVGIRLDRGLDWSEVADIVREGWRVAAPKKLAATLD